MADERTELRLRVSADIRNQVTDFAQRTGMSINAAAIALIREGLHTEHERRNTS